MIGLTRGMSPFTATLPALFAKTSIIYHPCIYVYKNKQLRTVLQRTLRCLYKSKRHSRGVLTNLPMKRYGIGSSQKQTLTDRTATMDDDVDFSGSVALNADNGMNYTFSTKT